MSAPAQVLQLVQRFTEQREHYLDPAYNETQVRREFLDPLFEALGWDVANRQGHAEAYKDVVHEDAIRVTGGERKAPDYSFRVGGARKFFLEAKKPSVNLKDDPSPALQLRRYAWSSKLPLSILSDFEEFAVYDCRIRPQASDKASVGRILYLRFDEFESRWDEIASVFGRDAVLKGGFDRWADSNKKKRGTAEVDAAFLGDIEGWREQLARNIASRNPALTQRELNYAVQQTIDRIIFLRICEDRRIETYGQLGGLVNGAHTYKRLKELFVAADARYNSGLFHFKDEKDRSEGPDQLTPGLTIDDKVLKDILGALYYPQSSYEFSVMPADILGQVYEQFLGKVIRLTAGHQAKVEEKPEVKKAGGVYYTPTYIVDYIVRETVGKLVEGRTPKEADAITILDPACGSGSFLIGAYQYLLDWYVAQYAQASEKYRKQIYQGRGGVWRLTTPERKRILLNSIYGVDIDPQAVEVTKLSLLLKVLEGESPESLQQELTVFRQRALPDLAGNIKCGNSLIGPDFYDGQQIDVLDEESRLRINAFDWRSEFKAILEGRQAGFSAVIGNPPYIRMEAFKELKQYLKRVYACHEGRSDLYAYFVEKGHLLLCPGGRFGMILSNKFVKANYGKPLKRFLSTSAHVNVIVDFAGLPVFPQATVRTLVLISSRDTGANGRSTQYFRPPSEERFAGIISGLVSFGRPSDQHLDLPGSMFSGEEWLFEDQTTLSLISKLKAQGGPLKEYCQGQICRGVVSGLAEAFTIDSALRRNIIKANSDAEEILFPLINGRDIDQFLVSPQELYLIYTYPGVPIERYPAIQKHLAQFRPALENRVTSHKWYELQQPQLAYRDLMKGPKIVFPDIATKPCFALDENGNFGSNTVYFIPRNDPLLLGVLNSKVSLFYFRIVCAGLEGKTETYLRFFGQYLEDFPLPVHSRADGRLDRIAPIVENITSDKRRLEKTRDSHERVAVEREIALLEDKLNKYVYEAYGLSQAEIEVVEAFAEG